MKLTLSVITAVTKCNQLTVVIVVTNVYNTYKYTIVHICSFCDLFLSQYQNVHYKDVEIPNNNKNINYICDIITE